MLRLLFVWRLPSTSAPADDRYMRISEQAPHLARCSTDHRFGLEMIMIGKVVGALIGREIDRRDGEGGVKGALLGAASASLLRRMGPLGLVLGGAYAARQMWKRNRAGQKVR
jgi:hypothetical protein